MEGVNFLPEGIRQDTVGIITDENEHGSGETAGFEGFILKAEASGDDLGSKDVKATGIPFTVLLIGTQNGEARSVAVVEDLDHIHPGRRIFEIRFIQDKGAAILIEDAEDGGLGNSTEGKAGTETDRANDLQEARLAGAPVAYHTQVGKREDKLIDPGQEHVESGDIIEGWGKLEIPVDEILDQMKEVLGSAIACLHTRSGRKVYF